MSTTVGSGCCRQIGRAHSIKVLAPALLSEQHTDRAEEEHLRACGLIVWGPQALTADQQVAHRQTVFQRDQRQLGNEVGRHPNTGYRRHLFPIGLVEWSYRRPGG